MSIVYELDGKRQERRLEGGEIYYEKTGHKPEITVIRMDVPEEEKAYYESELRRLKRILGTMHGAQDLQNAVSHVEKALKQGRYSEARRWLLTSAVRAVRMKKPVSVSSFFDRRKSAVVIDAVNYGAAPFRGSIRLLKVPNGCKGPASGPLPDSGIRLLISTQRPTSLPQRQAPGSMKRRRMCRESITRATPPR